MKHLLLAAVAGLALTGAASAADLLRRPEPPPAIYTPPLFSWTGAYAGVNAGFGFRDMNETIYPSSVFIPAGHGPDFFGVVSPGGTVAGLDPFVAVPAGGTRVPLTNICGFEGCNNRRNGFVGGGQIGYNWQMNSGSGFVLGGEADIQYADMNSSKDRTFGNNAIPIPGGGLVGVPAGTLFGVPGDRFSFFDPRIGPERGFDWFGTVRGRLGYAFDRFLIYGTGGFAYGGGPKNDRFGFGGVALGAGGFSTPACSYGYSDCGGRIRVGWAAGGGLEYAFANSLSVRVEGLYVSLERRSSPFLGGSLPYATFAAPSLGIASGTLFAPASAFSLLDLRRNDSFAVVRAGLNYRFGWAPPAYAPAPVVARY